MMIQGARSSERGARRQILRQTENTGPGRFAVQGSRKLFDQPAATFVRSKSSDYDKKRMNPLQESMMKVAEQISEVKSNDNLEQKTKTELLESLEDRLKDLQSQLFQEQVEEKGDDKEEKAKDSNVSAAPGSTKEEAESRELSETLLSATSNLEDIKSSSEIAGELKTKAEYMQRSADGIREGWLDTPDSNIINRRQGEADELKSAVENAGKAVAGALADVIGTVREQRPNHSADLRASELKKEEVEEGKSDTSILYPGDQSRS